MAGWLIRPILNILLDVLDIRWSACKLKLPVLSALTVACCHLESAGIATFLTNLEEKICSPCKNWVELKFKISNPLTLVLLVLHEPWMCSHMHVLWRVDHTRSVLVYEGCLVQQEWSKVKANICNGICHSVDYLFGHLVFWSYANLTASKYIQRGFFIVFNSPVHPAPDTHAYSKVKYVRWDAARVCEVQMRPVGSLKGFQWIKLLNLNKSLQWMYSASTGQ